MSLLDRIERYAERVSANRRPDFIVGSENDPYLRRWWLLPRNRWFNIYLHEFVRSDDDRALHDHMYVNLSLLLRGRYVEETVRAGGVHRRVERTRGEIKVRLPRTAHRIELAEGERCWTLFITGPRMRNWGFHCPNGWRRWQDFVAAANSGAVGPGCD